ncbi:hypothetical protein F5Y15DRAFT_290596 [Xylariaceae sp. FL0016]|nr:hypothetical protein F5Y15DRAFT_290596 [Xylariaceae sp. FL0016]
MTSTEAQAQRLKFRDSASMREAFAATPTRPVLTHLNADTTWLLQLPRPTGEQDEGGVRRRRSYYNILIDPWLSGPQSDLASWFSTQWLVTPPAVTTIAELECVLRELERDPDDPGATNEASPSFIDAVAISHEFTDHCHEATLRQLDAAVPVLATDKAAELIRGWKHFDTVVTTPAFSGDEGRGQGWRDVLGVAPLPDWLGIGRVTTKGNALYYHSALIIAFDPRPPPSSADASAPEAVLYSPHGIQPDDLVSVAGAGIRTLALLHGLHDVRIWLTKQLNLGALNGLRAVRTTGARYWVATHDEIKKGGGFIAPLLRRTKWTVRDAVEGEDKKMREREKESRKEGEEVGGLGDYNFVELGSGEGLILI